MDEITRLQKEVDFYKERYEMILQIHDSQNETIKTYHNLVLMQEAELKKLRGE